MKPVITYAAKTKAETSKIKSLLRVTEMNNKKCYIKGLNQPAPYYGKNWPDIARFIRFWRDQVELKTTDVQNGRKMKNQILENHRAGYLLNETEKIRHNIIIKSLPL